MPWDRHNGQDDTFSTREPFNRTSRDISHRDSRDSQRLRIERLGIGPPQNHSRNDSGNASSTDFAPEHTGPGRKHDYDLHAMETTLQGARLKDSKNMIPFPTVTVRSEFPTLTRSRQQQSLTCLVTIEVPEVKWQAQFEDVSHTPPAPSAANNSTAGLLPVKRGPEVHPAVTPYESAEVLEEITEELRTRVDNWHGLDFQR